MKLIVHRRNTVPELAATPREYGVEIDLRTAGDALVLHHDPFAAGADFRRWLDAYRHGTLILNVKEDGLEPSVTAPLRERGIEDYFFLDQAFPSLVRSAGTGERRCAVRVSEYESITTALTLAGRIDWVWVDCFTRFPLTSQEAQQLRGGRVQALHRLTGAARARRDGRSSCPGDAVARKRHPPRRGLHQAPGPVEARGLRRVKMLSLHPLFFVGAAIRLGLVLALAPVALSDWYAPFMQASASRLDFDPWSGWLAAGGDPLAFPYGYVMWLAFLPSAWLAEALALPAQYGYWLTLVAVDVGLLFSLHRLVPGMPTHRLLTWYWLSPIVLLATYGHGLNDLVRYCC